MTGSNMLPVIEAAIRTERDACSAAAQTSIEEAIKCGRLLEEAKGLLKHGQWLPWLRDNCGLSERSAQRYMRLARKIRHVSDLAADAADRLLASSGRLPLDDLSQGALGFDFVVGTCVHIKPCGRNGVYSGWSHIIVLHANGDDDSDGTMTRTLEGVHEGELVAWLRHHGVDVDRFTWHPSTWEPELDTFRLERLLDH